MFVVFSPPMLHEHTRLALYIKKSSLYVFCQSFSQKSEAGEKNFIDSF